MVLLSEARVRPVLSLLAYLKRQSSHRWPPWRGVLAVLLFPARHVLVPTPIDSGQWTAMERAQVIDRRLNG